MSKGRKQIMKKIDLIKSNNKFNVKTIFLTIKKTM